jgi:hypothetical protein
MEVQRQCMGSRMTVDGDKHTVPAGAAGTAQGAHSEQLSES